MYITTYIYKFLDKEIVSWSNVLLKDVNKNYNNWDYTELMIIIHWNLLFIYHYVNILITCLLIISWVLRFHFIQNIFNARHPMNSTNWSTLWLIYKNNERHTVSFQSQIRQFSFHQINQCNMIPRFQINCLLIIKVPRGIVVITLQQVIQTVYVQHF